uniref:Uncharacterized protein n=1 Tax=Anopheles epiroticus TaxID=199890 RepID=A0A182PU96_9DIPT
MTVGSVKHPNVLPQPAAASSARAYNGTGSSGGVGGGIGRSDGSRTHGSVGSGAHRSSGLGGGRTSPQALSNMSSAYGRIRPATKRCLFDRPDPIVTKRMCDDNDRAERQRTINRYGFDPHTGHGLISASSLSSASSTGPSSSSSSGSSVSAGMLHHNRCHH